MPPKRRAGAKKLSVNKKNTEPLKVTNSGAASGETASGLSQEAEDQYELELCWCIQQLGIFLCVKRLHGMQANEFNKNISILKSNTAPLIKKRQIMRNTLGNYREQMALEEQKFAKAASSIKFVAPSSENKKYTFLKKAASTSMKEKQHSETHKTSVNCSENSADIDNLDAVFKFNFQIKE